MKIFWIKATAAAALILAGIIFVITFWPSGNIKTTTNKETGMIEKAKKIDSDTGQIGRIEAGNQSQSLHKPIQQQHKPHFAIIKEMNLQGPNSVQVKYSKDSLPDYISTIPPSSDYIIDANGRRRWAPDSFREERLKELQQRIPRPRQKH